MPFHDYSARPVGFGSWADMAKTVAGYDWPTEEVSFNNPPSFLIEPPPSGYPRIIVHPERPGAAFALIEDGWYRSPTGEVVSYRTVADYVLTAQGVDRSALMKALGQVPGSGSGLPSWTVVVVVAAVLGLLLIRR